MALTDRLKAQAAQLAQKAQEAGKAGQAKLEEVQARRRADATLRKLGAAVYAQHAGRGTDDTAAAVAQLVSELSEWESQHGPLGDGVADEPSDDTDKGD